MHILPETSKKPFPPIYFAALVGLIIELRDTFAYQLFVHITFKAHNRLLDPLGLASRFGGNFIASQTLKRLPGFLGQGFSQSDYFGMSIHAKDKFDPLAIPAVQLGAQREIGVST